MILCSLSCVFIPLIVGVIGILRGEAWIVPFPISVKGNPGFILSMTYALAGLSFLTATFIGRDFSWSLGVLILICGALLAAIAWDNWEDKEHETH